MKFWLAFYGLLVHLYPSRYQIEFGEEMRSVFAALLADSAGTGRLVLLRRLGREVWDLPGALVCARSWDRRRHGAKGWKVDV